MDSVLRKSQLAGPARPDPNMHHGANSDYLVGQISSNNFGTCTRGVSRCSNVNNRSPMQLKTVRWLDGCAISNQDEITGGPSDRDQTMDDP